MKQLPWMDFALSAFVLLVAGAVFSQTAGLPPGLLDVLGPARVPQGICLILAVLALIHLARSIRRDLDSGESPPPARRRAGLAFSTLALTVLYAAVLHTRAVDYGLTTTVYVLVVGAFLNGLERRPLAVVAVLALVMGFGSDFVFTRFFYVDLP